MTYISRKNASGLLNFQFYVIESYEVACLIAYHVDINL